MDEYTDLSLSAPDEPVDLQDLVSENEDLQEEEYLQESEHEQPTSYYGTNNQDDALLERIEALERKMRNSLSSLTVTEFNELSDKFERIAAEIQGTSRNPGIAAKLEQFTSIANKISYALGTSTAAAENLHLSQSGLKNELNGIRAAISSAETLADVLKNQSTQLRELTAGGGDRLADGIVRRLSSPENQERIALQMGVLTRNATDDLATRFAERLESNPVKLGINDALHSLIEAETAKLKNEISQSKIKCLITADGVAKLQVELTAARATIETLEKSREEAANAAEKYRNLHNTLLDKINHGSGFFDFALKFIIGMGVIFLAGIEIANYL